MNFGPNDPERRLENYLCSDNNLMGWLKLKFIARQVRTPVGIIDILAYDEDEKAWVIIELKSTSLDSSAYFQLKKYLHYFRGERGKNGRKFIGLLVGPYLSKKISYAVNFFWFDHYERGEESVYYVLYEGHPSRGGFELGVPCDFQGKIHCGDYS